MSLLMPWNRAKLVATLGPEPEEEEAEAQAGGGDVMLMSLLSAEVPPTDAPLTDTRSPLTRAWDWVRDNLQKLI